MPNGLDRFCAFKQNRKQAVVPRLVAVSQDEVPEHLQGTQDQLPVEGSLRLAAGCGFYRENGLNCKVFVCLYHLQCPAQGS